MGHMGGLGRWRIGKRQSTLCFKFGFGEAEQHQLKAMKNQVKTSSKQYSFLEMFPPAETLLCILLSGPRQAVGADLPHLRFVKALGAGTYGVVSQYRSNAGEVAVKTMQNFASNHIAARRCLREINIMKCLKHSNIVSLKEVVA